jgi:hypothetical protein
MKRFIAIIIIMAACSVGSLSARGLMPFVHTIPALEPVQQFLLSRAGTMAAIVVPVALAVLLYIGEIFRLGSLLLLGIFTPVIDEEKRINRTLTRQMEANEKKLNATEQALKEFTTAVAEYARHLSSHTSAVRGLDESSNELNKGNAAQNRFLEDLIKNTEERLVSKEALLATLKVNMASSEEPVSSAPQPVPEAEKPAPERPLPSYRALHPPAPEIKKPAPETKKPGLEQASLVEAMVLPYYRALDELDSEKPAPEAENPSPKSEKATAEAKKAVESIMFPLYRTLYKADTGGSLTAAEKPDEATQPSSRKARRAFPPGCARRLYPPKP